MSSLKNGTIMEYDEIIGDCRDAMVAKNQDYGVETGKMNLFHLLNYMDTKICYINELKDTKRDEEIEEKLVELVNLCVFSIMEARKEHEN